MILNREVLVVFLFGVLADSLDLFVVGGCGRAQV